MTHFSVVTCIFVLNISDKGVDPFDILPEGWVIVTHNCGMPIYLHKQLRVCTLSKPYFLGPGSARVSMVFFLAVCAIIGVSYLIINILDIKVYIFVEYFVI